MPDRNQNNPMENQLEDLLKSIDEEMGDATAPQPENLEAEENIQAIHLTDSLSLLINQSKTRAFLRYTPPSRIQNAVPKASEIIRLLKQHQIQYGLIEKNIQKTITLIRDNPYAEVEVAVAVGRLPTPPQPPEVEYWIGNEPGFDGTEKIYARKNDLLLKTSLKIEGITGTDIFGEEIPYQDKKTNPIHEGDNVINSEDREYYAAKPGYVTFADNVLTVHEDAKDGAFFIQISKDQMKATLTVQPPFGKGKAVNLKEVFHELSEQGIIKGIDKEKIKSILDHVQQTEKPADEIVIAQGIPPSTGRHEKVHWHISPQADTKRFVVEENGTVDFHNVNNIISINKETKLVTITPATRGNDGYTVLGQVLEGKWGRRETIHAGENVVKRNNGQDWFAECNGYLFFENNTINVRPVYIIRGDVDYSTGNINFPGDVIVMGNVLDGFEIQANKSILVQGSVEAAFLKAGENIQIQKGLFGKEKGAVYAEQDVIAGFFQNATVEAGRNVIAGNQILNSFVRARISIETKRGKGSITGGELIAGHSIIAKVIGSEFGTRTDLEVGLDFFIFQEMEEINKKRITFYNQYTKL
ncbi:DUF342 domain-containing protein, partial [bacterium]|nr:DUF342 domain-containing protein [bacterium]